MKKKLISMLLIVVLMFTMIPAAFAESVEPESEAAEVYTLEDLAEEMGGAQPAEENEVTESGETEPVSNDPSNTLSPGDPPVLAIDGKPSNIAENVMEVVNAAIMNNLTSANVKLLAEITDALVIPEGFTLNVDCNGYKWTISGTVNGTVNIVYSRSLKLL